MSIIIKISAILLVIALIINAIKYALDIAKNNIRVGRTYEDTINATDSIWINGEKVEEAEIVKQAHQDEMLEEEE